MGAVAAATTDDACGGEWYGLIDISTDEFVIAVSVHRTEFGQCAGTLQVPDRDALDIPLHDVQINGQRFTFSANWRGQILQFTGSMSPNGRVIGQVKVGQFPAPFKLARDAAILANRVPAHPISPAQVDGIPTDRPALGAPDHPAIQYAITPTHDPLRMLNERLASGGTKLAYDSRRGYLPAVLAALGIDVDSQIVVYSKTSVQASRIGPKNPRALYFRDDVTVGYIQNAPFLEFVSLDPRQGLVFYTLDQKEVSRPQLIRRNDCLSCHLSRNAMGVPGMLVRSVVTDNVGRTYDQFGDHHPDHRTPIAERWGGWYVTGNAGSMRHLGNAFLENENSLERLIRSENLSLGSLRDRFDTEAYESPFSDIAALLVFEHQAHMTNLLVRMGWDARAALAQADTTDPKLVDRLLANDAQEVADYMLFLDEAPLTGRIEASSTFATSFSLLGPNDRRGRSLRQLDLEKRLLRYPCSYMIYSDAFDALPQPAKDAIYRRIWRILTGQPQETKYSRLSSGDRRSIREILIDTKHDLPNYFK